MKHLALSAGLCVAALAAVCSTPSAAAETDAINVYGPGGPAPAMMEAAKVFGAAHRVTVNVVAGPTPQ